MAVVRVGFPSDGWHADGNSAGLPLLLGTVGSPRGFIKAVALATRGHPDTVATGVRELEGGAEPAGQVRAPGGGRKPATENDPGLGPALRALVDPQSRGDPVVAGKIPRAIGTGRRCVEPGHRPSSGEGKLWAAGEPERAEQLAHTILDPDGRPRC